MGQDFVEVVDDGLPGGEVWSSSGSGGWVPGGEDVLGWGEWVVSDQFPHERKLSF